MPDRSAPGPDVGTCFGLGRVVWSRNESHQQTRRAGAQQRTAHRSAPGPGHCPGPNLPLRPEAGRARTEKQKSRTLTRRARLRVSEIYSLWLYRISLLVSVSIPDAVVSFKISSHVALGASRCLQGPLNSKSPSHIPAAPTATAVKDGSSARFLKFGPRF